MWKSFHGKWLWILWRIVVDTVLCYPSKQTHLYKENESLSNNLSDKKTFDLWSLWNVCVLYSKVKWNEKRSPRPVIHHHFIFGKMHVWFSVLIKFINNINNINVSVCEWKRECEIMCKARANAKSKQKPHPYWIRGYLLKLSGFKIIVFQRFKWAICSSEIYFKQYYSLFMRHATYRTYF